MTSSELSSDLECLWSDDCTWLDTLLGPFFDLFGEPAVGVLTASVLVMAFYVYNDDLAMPATISLLLGGTLLSIVPGDIQQTGVGFLVVGGVAAFMAVWRRFSL